MRLRPPKTGDGARIWRLVREAGELEVNSAYAYLLLADHFADTCLVAEPDAKAPLAGAVVGYRPPRRPDTLFVWQVAVAPDARGTGLGRRLLVELVERSGARWLEASVTPGNAASRALFRSFARSLGAPCRVSPYLTPELFPEPHEAEELFRIGPLNTNSVASAGSDREPAAAARKETR